MSRTHGCGGIVVGGSADASLSSGVLKQAGLLLQAVVVPGKKATEGRIIESIEPAWLEIARINDISLSTFRSFRDRAQRVTPSRTWRNRPGGKTPALKADEARQLLDSIPLKCGPVTKPGQEDKRPPCRTGLRARALIAVMVYSFARVSAALGMKKVPSCLGGNG